MVSMKLFGVLLLTTASVSACGQGKDTARKQTTSTAVSTDVPKDADSVATTDQKASSVEIDAAALDRAGKRDLTINRTTDQIKLLNDVIASQRATAAQNDALLASFGVAYDPAVLAAKAEVLEAVRSIGTMVDYVNSPGYVDSRGYVREALFNALNGYIEIQAMLLNDLALNVRRPGVPSFPYPVAANYAGILSYTLNTAGQLRNKYNLEFTLQFLTGAGKTQNAVLGYAHLQNALSMLARLGNIYYGARAAAILSLANAQLSMAEQFDIRL